jgi:CMP-N,N'-diacetyllegionaminic acid synthase
MINLLKVISKKKFLKIRKKYLFIIPARAGSTRLKNKNKKKLKKKPLIYWTLKELKKIRNKHQVVISSDDNEIIKFSRKMKFDAPFKRPYKLCTKTSKIIKTIQHALKYYQGLNIYFENICLLQVTSPLRKLHDIQKSIKIFERDESDTLISVFKLSKIFDKDLFYTQKANRILSYKKSIKNNLYVMNGPAVLISSVKNIHKNKLYGKKISYYEMPYHRSFDINFDADFKICEKLI